MAIDSSECYVDWKQAELNGFSYCFHRMDGGLCGRAERWLGHHEPHSEVYHPFVKISTVFALWDAAAWTRDEIAKHALRLEAEVRALRARKDGAYLERNQVVAALAKCFPSGVARTAIEGWSDDWHGCVYIDLPTGQVSWHFHDSHAHLFAELPTYSGKWDGHDTPEKYRRLAAMASRGEGE